MKEMLFGFVRVSIMEAFKKSRGSNIAMVNPFILSCQKILPCHQILKGSPMITGV